MADISVRRLNHEDYTVACICPMGVELAPVEAMLDEIHPSLPSSRDTNSYTLGQMGAHNVVIAVMPEIGNNSAASVATQLLNDFRSVKFGLLVGIGGGIPGDDEDDIRLGDVVVSRPTALSGGVVQFDKGKIHPNGRFEPTGTLRKPPTVLMASVNKLEAQHRRIGNRISKYISEMLEKFPKMTAYAYPGKDKDQLFEAGYNHSGGQTCRMCDRGHVVERDPREDETPRIHYGIIGSSNKVIKDSGTRDKLRKDLDILCVEMEAAGLTDELPCLVIRGICDYADSHKNKRWQPYAAATAASYAKELLSLIPTEEKVTMAKSADAVQTVTDKLDAPWLMPFERNPHFVGRESQIKELEEKLSPTDVCPRVAIFGLGGVGKTQIALEFAHGLRTRAPECAVFWIPAITTASFNEAYLEIAKLLQIQATRDKTDVKQLVQSRLSDESSGEWLLIIDNADDIDILMTPTDGSNSPRLIDYLPGSRKGSIIFTTRTRKAAMKYAKTDVIEVLQMDQVDAKKVLQKSLFRTPVDEDEAVEQLLDLLTFLPLAIIQAAAYINENDVSISGYIAIYNRDSEKDIIEVLSEDFEDRGRYREMENSIATTWLISFEQIQRRDQLAIEYLSFMACLVRESIPASLLPPGASKKKEIDAIGTLTAYSFITKRDTTDLFDIHRLVYLATRNWLKNQNQLSTSADSALVRLEDVLPFGGHEYSKLWTAYLPHAIHVAASVDISDEKIKLKIILLDKIGRCQNSIGQYGASVGTQRRTLELSKKFLGKEHPQTLTSMSELAYALEKQGMYSEAEKIGRQTLVLKEKVLGEEHSATLTSMSNLAEVLTRQGKYAEAEKMHWQTLEMKEKALGKEHPSTLTIMNNLAMALSDQGNYVEAEKMHQQTLEMKEKALGKEHPSTLTSMNNLAAALSNQGKYAEAEKMNQQSLELCEKVLGKEHPGTLRSMNNLAMVLSHKGNYVKAEKMNQQTLEMREKVLGKEHPETLTSMNNLAAALSDQGKYAEAEKMHQQSLEMKEKALGKEHPSTLTSMNNLAAALSDQGKYAEAEKMHQQSLEMREKVLGKEHVSTITSIWNLADLLQDQGRYNESAIFYQRACTSFQKVLGSDHPDTRSCSEQYADLLEEMKEYSGGKRRKTDESHSLRTDAVTGTNAVIGNYVVQHLSSFDKHLKRRS